MYLSSSSRIKGNFWDTLYKTPLHNVYFVKYDVTVSFMAQVLDTVTYFVSHVLDSGYSDIFWHIL